MRGRHGPDPLSRALAAVCLGSAVLSILLPSSRLSLVAAAAAALAVFRTLSRNSRRRQQENLIYLALRDRLAKKLLLHFNRLREFRTHKYLACPSCRTVLRLKRKGGAMTVRCPKCHEQFEARLRF